MSDVEFIVNRDRAMEEYVAALRVNVGKATQRDLQIPDLLEAQRQRHLIPTGAFKCFPPFDWVYIYQIGRQDMTQLYETYGDTQIVMPETLRDYKRDEACRGVLVGAGPGALDCLRTNGIELGHIVTFAKYTPFRKLADYVASKELWVLCMRVESINGSETAEELRRAGTLNVVWDMNHQIHTVETEGVSIGTPQNPWAKTEQTL